MEDRIILNRTSGKRSNILIIYTGPWGIEAFRNDNGVKDYFSKSTNLVDWKLCWRVPRGIKTMRLKQLDHDVYMPMMYFSKHSHKHKISDKESCKSLGYGSCMNTFILLLGYTENHHKSEPCFLVKHVRIAKRNEFISVLHSCTASFGSIWCYIHPIDTITLYVFRFLVCSNLGEPVSKTVCIPGDRGD